jgi:hypothetical protein
MTSSEGTAAPTGRLGLRLIRAGGESRELTPAELRPVPWPIDRVPSVVELARLAAPGRGLPDPVNEWRKANVRLGLVGRGLSKVALARALKLPHFHGALYLTVWRDGEPTDLGLASLRLVTTAGVKYLTDDMAAGANDSSNFKFHALGTGTNAEAVADTALQTELTTQYSTDNVRPTGSQASATAGANATYTTVGTITVDAAVAATEHGILSQAAVAAASAANTLLDRSVFSVVNLASGDSLQGTYVFTINSGG